MDDGVVLLADRWVARRERRARPADGARALALRAAPVRRAAVRPAAGRARTPGRDPERARHVRLRRRVQPVRRARRRRWRRCAGCALSRGTRAGSATIGPSYLGFVQWAIAAEAGDDLAAMAIQVSASQFHGQTYAGSSLSLENVASWLVIIAAQERRLAPLAISRALRALPVALADLPLDRPRRARHRSGGGLVPRGVRPARLATTRTGWPVTSRRPCRA